MIRNGAMRFSKLIATKKKVSQSEMSILAGLIAL
jgi:hypothetical protein